MNTFDYPALKRGFNKSAKAYPKGADLFSEINQLFIERLSQIQVKPLRILDLGAGTGQLSRSLLKIFPQARIYCLDIAHERLSVAKGKRKWFRQQHYITGDMHTLPFASESFDLVVSNLTWYWADHFHQAIYEAKRVLKINGQLLFTTLGPDTLRELRASFASISNNPHINQFLDMHDVGDALLKAGLADPVMDTEHLTKNTPSVSALLHFLQGIGESNYHSMRSRNLLSKKHYLALCQHYEQFRINQSLPVTLEIVLGYAWRKQNLSDTLEKDDIVIPLSAIKKNN